MLEVRRLQLKLYDRTCTFYKMEREWKPNVEICPPCPRCGSSNTKFCYYNNYSLTQPRYFCKGCRRYWTKGGSLRNIPVGGGCRKARRTKSIRVYDTINSHNFLARGDIIENRSSDGGSMIIPPKPTNIDIQQVYANFLNQRPQTTYQEQMHDPVLNGELDPMSSSSFGFSSIPTMEMEFGATNFGLNLESFLNEGSGMQFCGYNSIFSNQDGGSGVSNSGLPPLPGEEFGWSSETNIGFQEHVLDTRIEPEEYAVKMIDMPVNSDTIFRP